MWGGAVMAPVQPHPLPSPEAGIARDPCGAKGASKAPQLRARSSTAIAQHPGEIPLATLELDAQNAG